VLGSKNLTAETAEQAYTFPGQAHFAVFGAGRHCFECWYWNPRRKSDKRAICSKAAQMMRSETPRVPRHATICQYFTEEKPEDLTATKESA
jgi:hypothetical protein